ncbi:MAG: hypothetical protein AAGJ17_00030 [Pseudomonadota bacterium]
MSKHKHYEIGVAKLANTKLVVFIKDGSDWFFDDTSESYNFRSDVEYFLCLPQHKEACLHWLNGGETEFEDDDGEWVSCSDWSKKWRQSICGFMQDDNVIRIKPKKVKRWIGVYGADTTRIFSSKENCKNYVENDAFYKNCAPENWQFIEIEVEE